MTTDPRPRRRWFSYSLRTAFACMTLLAVASAWVAYERRESQRQLQAIANLGDAVTKVEFCGPFDATGLAANAQPMWRQQLRSVLGPRVHTLSLNATGLQDLYP